MYRHTSLHSSIQDMKVRIFIFCEVECILRVSDQNGISGLYIIVDGEWVVGWGGRNKA